MEKEDKRKTSENICHQEDLEGFEKGRVTGGQSIKSIKQRACGTFLHVVVDQPAQFTPAAAPFATDRRGTQSISSNLLL